MARTRRGGDLRIFLTDLQVLLKLFLLFFNTDRENKETKRA